MHASRSISGLIILCLCIIQNPLSSYAQVPLDIEFEYFDKEEIAIANELYAIVEDRNDRLWISNSEGGIVIYDGYGFEYLIYDPEDSTSIFSQNAFGLYKDNADHIWAGFFNGLSQFSEEGNLVRNYNLDFPKAISRNYIHCFLDHNSKEIWVGTNEGIVLLNKERGHFQLFQDSFIMEREIFNRGNRIFRLHVDRDDGYVLWVGSGWGLKRFNIITKTYEHINHPPLWHNVNPGAQLAMVDMNFEIEGKIILAAGYSGGVKTYDYVNKEWQTYLHNDRILEDVNRYHKVQSIIVVDDSTILYSSYFGFGFINFESETLELFTNFDFERVGRVRESLVDRNGVLWLAGEKALVRSKHPIVHTINESIPILRKFEVDSEPVHKHNQDDWFVSKDQEEITFDIALVNPTYIDSVLYRWKLIGFDQDWCKPTYNRMVNYNNLSGGEYSFEFQAKDRSHPWKSGDKINFKIERKLFEKTWFLPTCLFSLIVLFVYLFRLFSQISEKRNNAKLEYEKRILEAELSGLRSQMNPHFIFNSLNSIYNFIHSNETEHAADYLAKFSKLMRQVLQNSKEKMVSIDNEVKMLELYLELEQIRFDRKFRYEIFIDEKIQRSDTFLPPMIIQPYLENAIWHGIMHKEGSGKLILRIIKSEYGKLNICIEDDGVGRSKSYFLNKSKSKKSYGTSITQQRLDAFEVIHGHKAKVAIIDLKDKNGNPTGTKVEIEIPEIKN